MNIGLGIVIFMGSFILLVTTLIQVFKQRKKPYFLAVLTLLGFNISILLLSGIYDPYANNHNIQ
ncbi:hypothetical protein [Bacillus sp. AFS041924]|uniref:hypothetical protein n=1 Tax=Bacillus sp. AFS041924 TaxID=2033503 RepID=UPI000BFBCED1|nr:hypothetical protein [Bacillus sp. AFS041924]PGS55951.1 hypothetical protein COC46_03070 [Bacillus sp. AFS041924]